MAQTQRLRVKMKGDQPRLASWERPVKEFTQSVEAKRGKWHRRDGDFILSAQLGGIKVGDLFAKYLNVTRRWVLEECRKRPKMGVMETVGARRQRMELKVGDLFEVFENKCDMIWFWGNYLSWCKLSIGQWMWEDHSAANAAVTEARDVTLNGKRDGRSREDSRDLW